MIQKALNIVLGITLEPTVKAISSFSRRLWESVWRSGLHKASVDWWTRNSDEARNAGRFITELCKLSRG